MQISRAASRELKEESNITAHLLRTRQFGATLSRKIKLSGLARLEINNMDWNWFFSSLAQSSAAIVGIFAAFTITKIINSQAEFERKRIRMLELNAASEQLIDSFKDRDFGTINRYQIQIFQKRYREMLEKDESMEPDVALDRMLIKPTYVPFEAWTNILREAKEKYLGEKKEKAAQSTMTAIMRLTSGRDASLDPIIPLTFNTERDRVNALATELKHHIRLCKLHRTQIKGNPESSSLVTFSIWGTGILFFVGVLIPLSFLRVINESGSGMYSGLNDWWVGQLNIKGTLVISVAIIFYGILWFFNRENNKMRYLKDDVDALEGNTNFVTYSPYLKINEDNVRVLRKRAKPVIAPPTMS